MENSGEAEDDQGSGWFEVKKKNRTSSKLASQKVSGGSSFKTNAYSLRNQSSNNDEAWKFHCVQQPQTLRAGFVAAAHPKVTADSPGLPLVREDEGTRSIDKVVANQENQPPKKIVSGTMTAKGLGEKEKIEEAPMKKNVDVNLKIKWGDLEEESMAIIGTCLDSSASLKTKCTDEDDGSQISPCTPLQKETLMKQSESVQQFPGGMQPLLLPKESADESCEEANETLTEAMVLVDSSAEVITEKNADEGGMTIPSEATESVPSAIAEEAEDVTIHRSRTTSEIESLNIPAVSIIAEKVSIQVGLEEIKLLDHQKSSAADPIGIDDAAAMAKGNFIQNASADGADLGECESEESKERFRQRLWCFLFENLNRAVDELYLLCELECDKEQMDEAILVLEEAASDFRELKSRVENFESTKRSPSQSPKNSQSVTLKLEHRRPHALSWEVRRMTNSPHRAEILSSSLETFKKIQQERFGALAADNARDPKVAHPACLSVLRGRPMISPRINDMASAKPGKKLEKQAEMISSDQEKTSAKKQNGDSARMNKAGNSSPNERISPESLSASAAVRSKREPLEPISETQKQVSKKDKIDRQSKGPDMVRKLSSLTDKEKEKEKEKRNAAPWKSLDAWKEKRNWEDILKSPMRPSRVSHSPGMGRKGQERARILHDKLMSPEKRKRSAMDMKREAEEKHARAMRIRSQLEHERMQRLQRTSEKLNRVNEWQAVRSLKLREGMHARHQRGESRHEAYLAQVVKRAGDESSKVNEVRFITSLNEENKKLMLRQKLHDSEVRRAEKLQVMRSKQKEDMAREEAVLERRKLLEAEKLQRLAETQRKKEEAQVRREEERKASSAAREARVMEQLRRKEVRAKAQQEEAELLALRLAERLRESEQRRKFYLEQIREKASMDFRDQSSPLVRRSLNKEGQNRSTNMVEDYQTSSLSTSGLINTTQQQSLKRKIKKIRQRLMALKHEFAEPSLSPENQGVGYRALVAGARAKVGRWLQELQRLRQARKEGAASIGLIVGDMIKFLDGKEPELHASRQAGLLDFISSALPASHTSKPEACQVTAYLLRLLRVVLSLPANRSYFLAQNLLPPIIPMLSASLENYIKMAASSCPCPGSTNLVPAKTLVENLESITDILDGFLWTVTTVIGHVRVDERQLQMQSGLVELIVAYQVIHCLRDLFALYDRPQVEGAPFPSSILLSLNLLTVLTSRPASISSIDWDSCIARTDFTYEIQEARLAKKSTELGNSHILNNTPLDDIVVDSPASGFGQEAREEKLGPGMVSGTDVPEGRPEDGQFMKKCFDNSVGSDNAGAASQGCTGTMCDLPRPIMAEEQAISQKDENVIDSGKERKGIHEDTVCESNEGKKEVSLKQPVVFLLYAVAETSLVSLPSLLTAVLLQANSRMSSEQASYVLPLNFEEVATGVLKVLNNLAVLDITLLQSLLARSDLKVEFFHLMSFLLSHCTSKWKTANDQIGLLLLESLLLLGYFALFHPENQAVLRWGKSPTILHKVCDLPFVFFSDPELTPILAGTLVAACYGCDQNRGVVRQELSMDMLLSVLKSCRQGVLSLQTDSSLPDNSVANDACDGANQSTLESKKPQVDLSARRRSLRVLPGKGGASGSSMRSSKTRTQRESRGSKTCDEWALKHSLPASEAPSTFMLHRKFPCAFLDKAEEFFSVGNSPI